MESVLELVTQLGLPTALLVVIAVHHVRALRERDAEIARLHALLLSAKDQEMTRLLEMQEEFMHLQGELERTLRLLTARRDSNL